MRLRHLVGELGSSAVGSRPAAGGGSLRLVACLALGAAGSLPGVECRSCCWAGTGVGRGDLGRRELSIWGVVSCVLIWGCWVESGSYLVACLERLDLRAVGYRMEGAFGLCGRGSSC